MLTGERRKNNYCSAPRVTQMELPRGKNKVQPSPSERIGGKVVESMPSGSRRGSLDRILSVGTKVGDIMRGQSEKDIRARAKKFGIEKMKRKSDGSSTVDARWAFLRSNLVKMPEVSSLRSSWWNYYLL